MKFDDVITSKYEEFGLLTELEANQIAGPTKTTPMPTTAAAGTAANTSSNNNLTVNPVNNQMANTGGGEIDPGEVLRFALNADPKTLQNLKIDAKAGSEELFNQVTTAFAQNQAAPPAPGAATPPRTPGVPAQQAAGGAPVAPGTTSSTATQGTV